VDISDTTLVPFKVSGTDSRATDFLGYGALTLKKTGPQPPLPDTPPWLFKQFSIRPDVILSTPDILNFNTPTQMEYGPPGILIMSGTAVFFDPTGQTDLVWEIEFGSTFDGRTREIVTTPIATTVPQGALEDVSGVANVQIANMQFQGFLTPDLKTAGMIALPGATVNLPNGVIQEFQGAALLQLTGDRTQGPDDPDILVHFAPNPVIYSITPNNEAILSITFTPGVGDVGAELSNIKCIASENFDILGTTNFVSLDDFNENNIATLAVRPPIDFVPENGAFITVTCEAIDGLGRRISAGDFLVYSNSPFQDPYPLPDIILGNFNTDPETASATPPEGVFPFDGDGLCFLVQNQLLFPGLTQPIVTGEAELTHFTKTDSFDPPVAHWEPFVDTLHGGQTFSLPFTGTLSLNDLTMQTIPIGTGGDCVDNTIGLLPDGRICFPAGEAQEDIFFNGAPQTLIAPLKNFALLGNFTPDLRTLMSTSALSCSARLACNGTNFCSFGEEGYAEPCNPGDENPNPFGVATYIFGIPPFPGFLPLPLNSFGLGQQVPAQCPINIAP